MTKGVDFGARLGSRMAEGRALFRQYFESVIEAPGPATLRLGAARRARRGTGHVARTSGPNGYTLASIDNSMTEEGTVLTIPGWNGSGPGHWQSIWEATHVHFRRVEQRNWQRPSREDWVDSIDRLVREVAPPIFLAAHSLGCVAVAHWAADHDAARIAGALLVAPPWLRDSTCPEEITSFLPMPLGQLPFRSILVASESDPYLPIEGAARLAQLWGSQFVNAGLQGHINTASGHGSWPAGEQLLEGLRASITRSPDRHGSMWESRS